MQLRPEPLLPTLTKVPNVVFPVFWADETATISDDNADLYKGLVKTPLLLVDIFVYGVSFGFSTLGIIVAVIFKIKLQSD